MSLLSHAWLTFRPAVPFTFPFVGFFGGAVFGNLGVRFVGWLASSTPHPGVQMFASGFLAVIFFMVGWAAGYDFHKAYSK